MKYVPRTKPFKHQAKATLFAARRRNAALFMEPRTGKTKASLDAIGMLALKGEVRRVLVVCPLIAIDVWDDQIRQHFPFRAHIETVEEEWIREADVSASEEAPTVRFFLINYEKLAYRKRHGSNWRHPYLLEVEAWGPQLVVCDESHKLKRPGGVTAQSTWRMVVRLRKRQGGQRPYVHLLTGTPNPKGWIDLFAQFRVMDDTVFGTNVADFREEHCIYGQGPRKHQIIKYRKVKRITTAVERHAFTCTAEEAGLANKQFWQTLHYNLPARVRRAYNELAEDFLTELESGVVVDAANAGVKRLRLLQIAGGYLTDGSEVHGEAIKKLEAYAAELRDQHEPLVCYARFSPEIAHCAEALEGVGFSTEILQGATKRRDRTNIISWFQRSKKDRAIVVQTQVGALSIELTAAAEAAFYSTPDGWVDYWQCLSRLCGPNQPRPVRYTHFEAKGTVHRSVVQGLITKEDWHRTLMRDPKRYLLGL